MDKLENELMKLVSFAIIVLSSCSPAPDSLVITDYELFKATEIWRLAKAARDEDVEEIKGLAEKGLNLNLQEPKFGATLLMVTIVNQDYDACKALLQAGADTEIPDKFSGTTPLIYAARTMRFSKDDTEFIKLLLSFGANPNAAEAGLPREGNSVRDTPLMAACRQLSKSPLEKVKLLVAAGADVNYRDEFGNSPIRAALTCEQIEVVAFLVKNGFDHRSPVSRLSNGKVLYLWDELRYVTLPLNSEQYFHKMAVVEYLRDQGIDYGSTPVPDVIVTEAKKMYPDTWQDYLQKY